MKFSIASVTAVFACFTATFAAPPSAERRTVDGLTIREAARLNNAIDSMNMIAVKRDYMSVDELSKRENKIVTDVLTAINSTGLAPGIIEYLIDDPELGNITTTVIIDAFKDGVIDISTFLKALNDSGLATQLIQDLISDCAFYAEIYKLVLQEIANLPQQIINILTGKQSLKRDVEEYYAEVARVKRAEYERNHFAKRATTTGSPAASSSGPSEQYQITESLMESLKNSGLASQVVYALVTDDTFYSWGADLIERLFSSGALTLGETIDALATSGLIPTIIENFINIPTLKTVIVNALAAAFGKCGGSTLTTIKPSSGATSSTPVTHATGGTGSTSTPTGTCKKRKRRSY